MIRAFAKVSIVDDRDEEWGCILNAHLACLLDGLEAAHIDSETYRVFCSIIKPSLEAAGVVDISGSLTGKVTRAEPMWTLFADAVVKTAESVHSSGRRIAFADTRDSNSAFRMSDLVSVGPLSHQTKMIQSGAVEANMSRFAHISSDDIDRKAYKRAELQAVVDCCNLALQRGLFSGSDYFKGDAERITWTTPDDADVKRVLARTGVTGLDEADITFLRDLLGLWAQDGKSGRPLAVFFIRCSHGLAAPNVFTARGYERFRHGTAVAPAVPTSGLTYNMDSASAATHPGAPEVVAEAVTLPQVQKLVSGGQPRRICADREAELAAHRRYAADVLRGRTVSDVLDGLAAFLP